MSTPLASAATFGIGNAVAVAKVNQLKAQPRKQGEASFFFYDAHFKNAAVKILPGEYFVDTEDLLVMTTLGSCIAACLWDRTAKVGGMNHFMLPEGNGDSGRYGSVVPGPSYQDRGRNCRAYTETIYIDGRPQTARGTACRNPDGSWTPLA